MVDHLLRAEVVAECAQTVVREGQVDSIGVGRMVLSYPELLADVLAGKVMTRKRLCRTFSDCTTAPRNGIVSGCFPLDAYYKTRSDKKLLDRLKQIAFHSAPFQQIA